MEKKKKKKKKNHVVNHFGILHVVVVHPLVQMSSPKRTSVIFPFVKQLIVPLCNILS